MASPPGSNGQQQETDMAVTTTRSDIDAFEPAQLGPLTLRNRVIKAATFEGVMPRGAVTDDLIEFHTTVA